MSSLATEISKLVKKKTDIKKPVIVSGVKVATVVIINTIKIEDLRG